MKTTRRLFDTFYVRTESFVNGQKDKKFDRKLARALGHDPRVTERYASEIRPYWKRFKVPPRVASGSIGSPTAPCRSVPGTSLPICGSPT